MVVRTGRAPFDADADVDADGDNDGVTARPRRALVAGAAATLFVGSLALGACSGGGVARSVQASRGSLTAARLDLVSGTDSVLVTSEDLGDQLFRVDTPLGTPQAPHATSHDGLVTVSLSDVPGHGARQVEIILNAAVAWTVSLDGGAVSERVDLSTAHHLRGLVFAAGSSTITAVLPPPSGDVRVLMAGGTSAYVVEAPAGAQTRVTFAGGAGSSLIDGAARSGIAGGTVVATPGWDAAADRYSFDNSAGVSSFTLTRV